MFYTGHPAETTSSDDSSSVETVAQGQGSSANEKVVQESESHSGTAGRVLVFPSPEKIKKTWKFTILIFHVQEKMRHAKKNFLIMARQRIVQYRIL